MSNLEIQLGSLRLIVAYLLRRDADRSGTPIEVMHEDMCEAVADAIRQLDERGGIDRLSLHETEAGISAFLDQVFSLASRIKSGSS